MCKTLTGMTSLIAAAILLGFIIEPTFASQTHAHASKAQIDQLIRLSDKAAGDGQLTNAVSSLRKALQIAEMKSPKRIYEILHQQIIILPGYDRKAMVAATDQMAVVADKYFGPNDYRTVYSHALQDLNAGNFGNDTARMLKNLPPEIVTMRRLARGPKQIAETAALNIAFVSNLVLDGQHIEAHKQFEISLASISSKDFPASRDVARVYIEASGLLAYWKDYAAAIDVGLRARSMLEKLTGPYSADLGIALANTGEALLAVGKAHQAEPLLAHSLNICEHSVPPISQNLEKILDTLGMLYDETSRPELAEPLFKRAVVISESLTGAPGDTAGYLGHLAALYLSTGKLELARETNKREIVSAEKLPNSPYVSRAYLRSAQIELDAGDYAAAAHSAEKGRELTSRLLPPGSQGNAYPISVLARIASKKGDFAHAADYWSDVLAIVAKRGYPNRDHETTAIHASAAAILAMRHPNWLQAREAGDSLTGRITDAALNQSNINQYNGYEQGLYNELLDVAWAETHAENH